jgi:hypothetical protein
MNGKTFVCKTVMRTRVELLLRIPTKWSSRSEGFGPPPASEPRSGDVGAASGSLLDLLLVVTIVRVSVTVMWLAVRAS